jgi:hypothetical protein
MFSIENSNKTLIELRNAVTTLRMSQPNDLNLQAMELVISHAMVDLSAAGELLTQMATENEQLKKELEQYQENSKDVDLTDVPNQ